VSNPLRVVSLSPDAFLAGLYENAEMFHRSTGAYKLLERPSIYRRFQALLGGPRGLRRFVDEFVRPSNGMTLLDVGCGTGSFLEYLPASVSYVGFDFNPAYIDAARRRYGLRGMFFCARVGEEPLEIQAKSFDLVVAVSLLHHLADDEAHQLLRAAWHVLRPGGAFVSIDGTFHGGQTWLARVLASLDRGRAVRSPEGYRRLLASHFPQTESWLLTDMIAIPYSHFVMRATKMPAA